MTTKTILCYGDSNTWGFDPATQKRFRLNERWTGVLAESVGNNYRIIEEGLDGRTTLRDDPIEEYRNGKDYLIPCLESHKPIDLVIIFLGTNDLKVRFSSSAYDIACSAGLLVNLIQNRGVGPEGGSPQVLLISPPVVGNLTDLAETFEGAREKSMKFGRYYHQIAEKQHCHFLDAARIVTSSDIDGIHLEASQHRKLGEFVADQVKDLLR